MPDALTAVPHVYKVVQENAQVRILDVRMKPGDNTEMHSHPAVVDYAVADGKFKFTAPDGQRTEIYLDPGPAMYMDAV